MVIIFVLQTITRLTNNNVINKKAATVAIIVPDVPAAKIILLYSFSVFC